MNEKVISEGERVAAQLTASQKRFHISARRVGRFGVMLGTTKKSAKRVMAEDLTMCQMVKTHLAPFFSLARFICCDAIDKVKEAGEYRHDLKRQLRAWEQELSRHRTMMMYPPEGSHRFFAVDSLAIDTRGMFREDLTDKDYFELWEYVGVAAFNDVHKIIYALQWKYEKALTERGFKKAKVVAWLYTASTVIKMYDIEFREVIDSFKRSFGNAESSLRRYFCAFDVSKLAEMWHRTIECFGDDAVRLTVECLKDRNVEIGLQDMMQHLSKEGVDLRFTRKAVEENPELFRSKKAWRDALEKLDEQIEEVEQTWRELRASGMTVDEFFKARRYGKTEK